MSTFVINREDLAEALKMQMGENADNDAINEFVNIFHNRLDKIIEEEARRFAGTYGVPPIGFA